MVKVFAIQDPSLPLRTYHNQIKETTDKLQYTSNVLPFEKIIITEKAGILVRQYIKDNLYDRIRCVVSSLRTVKKPECRLQNC